MCFLKKRSFRMTWDDIYLYFLNSLMRYIRFVTFMTFMQLSQSIFVSVVPVYYSSIWKWMNNNTSLTILTQNCRLDKQVMNKYRSRNGSCSYFNENEYTYIILNQWAESIDILHTPVKHHTGERQRIRHHGKHLKVLYSKSL